MTQTVVIPPQAQLAQLQRGYAEAISARRQQLMSASRSPPSRSSLAWIGAEVDPRAFFDKIGNFTGYFGRILHLDSGAIVLSRPDRMVLGPAGGGRACCSRRC